MHSDVERMLYIIDADFADNEQQVERILSSWETSLSNENMQGTLDGLGILRAEEEREDEGSKEKEKFMEQEGKDYDVPRYPLSFVQQVCVLTGHFTRNALRNPAVM